MWSRLAPLEVVVDRVDLVPHELQLRNYLRLTTVVRLSGGGISGQGEDVCWDPADQHAFRAARIDWPTGRFDLAGFCAALDGVSLFDRRPGETAYHDYRRWAVESAALDLALRQAGISLAEALDREPAPLNFVTSTGLGNPPSLLPLERVLRRAPGSRFKLDANPGWSQGLLDRLAAMGTVDVVDLKGAYRGTPVDTPADPALYRSVAETLPHALIEDPAWTEETAEALGPHHDRVSWDAPIHGVSDIEKLPFAPRAINIKPSRFGRLENLSEVYAYCDRHGIAMYGGGQFELGVGRAQIQALASLFHAHACNDVAPIEYHQGERHDTLPASPLAPVSWP